MRKLIQLTSGLLIVMLCLSAVFSGSFAETHDLTDLEIIQPPEPMKGIWVATVLNIDYPKERTTDPVLLKAEAISVLETAKNAGLNAVFLQVRPTADAFYPSAYFPWSKYLTGTQGAPPEDAFDPLEFWVEEAHLRDIELHAWLNPYRITKKTVHEASHDFTSLTPTHPARLNPQWVVAHTDGNLYFDPGIPQVRQLLIDSAMELVENYDIDGIHFDDYFYPGKDFDDADTFTAYGQEYYSIENWRRENVNTLIRDLHKTIQEGPRQVRFGISPFGIWANDTSHFLGSATRGNQTYFSHYADPLTWIREGSIDYIAPQLYWHIGFDIADYHVLLDWWHRATLFSSVDLYIGHAAYRTGSTDASHPWYGVDEINRQLILNKGYSGVAGSIFYNYSALAGNPALQGLLADFYGYTNPLYGKAIQTIHTY